MARVPYLEYEDASDHVRALYDAQRAITGRLTNFHKLLGYVPWMLQWILGLQRSIHLGPLPEELKRLVNVQVSLTNQCAYCTSHNVNIARRVGMSEEKLEALASGRLDHKLFSESEIAVIEWATAVADNSARRDTAAFAELKRHFTIEEIVEMTVLAAFRTLTNRVQEALWTDLEEDAPPYQMRYRLDLVSYARDVLVTQLEREVGPRPELEAEQGSRSPRAS